MSTADIESRAAEWLALEDGEWREEDGRALQAWLEESSAHRVAYLRLKAAWGRADRLAALRNPAMEAMGQRTVMPVVSPEQLEARPEPPRLSWPSSRMAAVAAGLALAIVGVVLTLNVGTKAANEYQTLVGGREIVPLVDGSRLELNTDTKVRTSVTSQSRTVWLERGEAYFDVARDESRPFVVIAGVRRITVLGTKFSVRRDDNDVQVKVLEGKVQVDALDSLRLADAAATTPAVATGGQVAVTRQNSTLVAQRSAQEIANELAWRQGVLVMNEWTLADAAREFNRYNHKKLVVGESVSGIRLGGTFESGNVEAFSRLLKDGFGLRVEAGSDQIIVSN